VCVWGGAIGATLGKTILNVFFNEGNIMNKYPQDPLHHMSGNLHRRSLFRCRNEFHIMPWPPEIHVGWVNKENDFSRWLHREN
jgi:hypothetical protein